MENTTLLRIIDQKDEEISKLKARIETLTLNNTGVNEMTFRGKQVSTMNKDALLSLVDYLFDRLKMLDFDIVTMVVKDCDIIR